MRIPQATYRIQFHKDFGFKAAQALLFLPLALGAATGGLGVIALFSLMTLYWGTGLATGPPWVTWIETLVPRRLRARYFGRRGIITSGALLAAILLAACGGSDDDAGSGERPVGVIHGHYRQIPGELVEIAAGGLVVGIPEEVGRAHGPEQGGVSPARQIGGRGKVHQHAAGITHGVRGPHRPGGMGIVHDHVL